MQGHGGKRPACHTNLLVPRSSACATSEASTELPNVAMHAASLDGFDDAWGFDDGMHARYSISFDRWLSDCVLRGLASTMQRAPLTAKANVKVLVLQTLL